MADPFPPRPGASAASPASAFDTPAGSPRRPARGLQMGVRSGEVGRGGDGAVRRAMRAPVVGSSGRSSQLKTRAELRPVSRGAPRGTETPLLGARDAPPAGSQAGIGDSSGARAVSRGSSSSSTRAPRAWPIGVSTGSGPWRSTQRRGDRQVERPAPPSSPRSGPRGGGPEGRTQGQAPVLLGLDRPRCWARGAPYGWWWCSRASWGRSCAARSSRPEREPRPGRVGGQEFKNRFGGRKGSGKGRRARGGRQPGP